MEHAGRLCALCTPQKVAFDWVVFVLPSAFVACLSLYPAAEFETADDKIKPDPDYECLGVDFGW
jgi:hypothetical protein